MYSSCCRGRRDTSCFRKGGSNPEHHCGSKRRAMAAALTSPCPLPTRSGVRRALAAVSMAMCFPAPAFPIPDIDSHDADWPLFVALATDIAVLAITVNGGREPGVAYVIQD